ncbi:WD40 repeat domain-containing protein [Deinococcus sp. QL22]|uniref:WD40 repeat domain-containing protein n=1 Tax=Deinococcus sp. QL22 TaxID=2939437 RepID=UPI0020173FFF|nr:hypothetical protein [Deinococcus sp. QL22]UQN08203.1 hypothetical protein M1R55_19170 [Deinococcus sp. QL22]
MRLLPAVLTALLPFASATSILSTTPIPGHAAGSFGRGDAPFGELTGGAAWSADSRTVFTLDTTRLLYRWQVGGQRLGTQLVKPPVILTNPGLNLSGAANAAGLPVLARGEQRNQPVTLAYRLKLETGQLTAQPGCSRPLRTMTRVACTLDVQTRIWLEGGELQWQRGDQVERFPLPAGLSLNPDGGRPSTALALSDDGQRVALLALRGEKDVSIFGGQGRLLTWTRNGTGQVKAQQVTLTGPPLYAGATLDWVDGRVLVASNVYNAGNEYGSGGALFGQQLALYPPGAPPVWRLGPQVGLRGAFPSPDGQLFVTIRDGSVPEVRRIKDGAYVRSLGEAVLDTAPLSGGRVLLAVQGGAGTGRVALHQPGSLKTLYRGRADLVAASTDGQRFASAFGQTLRLHSSSGQVLRAWQAAGRVQRLAFSPDGQVLSVEQDVFNGPTLTSAWRMDGSPFPLPAGTQFPVTSVLLVKESRKDGPQSNYRECWTVAERTGHTLWQTPWHSSRIAGLPSPDGRFLAQFGMTAQTLNPGELGPVPRVNVFSRVEAHTGKQGAVLRVPVEHSTDVYAGWGLSAFDGRTVLLAETSGDGCGGLLYGYRLADLNTGKLLNTPAQLRGGYERLIGCGHYAFRPKTKFAPDGRLLIQDGNRLDWLRLGTP